MSENDPMSLVDAEMSRLKGLLRVAERRNREYDVAARDLADYFIRKTLNLVTMRCTFCEMEWVRDCEPEHDGDCPVGVVKAFQAAPRQPGPEGVERD